MAPKRVKSFCS